ncbi:MAG TPA: metallophosphoesterase family protein [Miltoncostaeaceae bacterium]|nr:metallophosphoesterase family protein [Miltoncostaeaceae bacterium]
MRIGVVCDTHVGEHLPALPAQVCAALAGVDAIIHAGDLTGPGSGVLRELQRIAPVYAVRGNHDEDGGWRDLPRARVLSVGGRRIAVVHGTRPRPIERAGGVVSLVTRRPQLLGFHRAVRRSFGAVDVIVMGHIHMPVCERRRGALLFSPGAVYIPERDPWFDWSTLGGRAYRRFRALVPAPAREPAVGLIEIESDRLRVRRIPLSGPLRTRGYGTRPPGAPG